MAYANFKPTVWSKKIQQELGKLTVLQDNCNTKFVGDIGPGYQVKIIGAARPTVGTYVPGTNIAAAETPADTSVYLTIDQFKYVNIGIDDIDKAQSIEGVMAAYMEGASKELAETRDAYIGTMAKFAGTASASAAFTTAAAAKAAVDAGFVALWNEGVKISPDVSIEITPAFYNLFKDKLTELYTDNVELIRKGIVGMYNGAMVKISNNLYNDATDDYLMIRTKDAIAFAGGIHKTEPYRPDLLFQDAVKVLDTFGAKVVRPKELYVIKAH